MNKEFAFPEPTITVDPLPLGLHQFELVVENDVGQRSAPVQFSISVFGQAIPPVPPLPPVQPVPSVQPDLRVRPTTRPRSARPKKRAAVKRVRKRKPSK